MTDPILQGHPCFGGNRHKYGRLHLPVAPACNIQCAFCVRKHDCVAESRPGVTSRVLTPRQALQRVRLAMEDPALREVIRVVGIAGPGDPLANEATFETFRLVRQAYPDLITCLSTNGLLLPGRFRDLVALGLPSLTVTINALDPEVGSRIYSKVVLDGRPLGSLDGARALIASQLEGVALAAREGIVTKVNTVLIPGVNEEQIPLIAQAVKDRGAFVMNIMPLIPQGAFAALASPTEARLGQAREESGRIMPQFRHCSQCRADAVGLITETTCGGYR
jgi:nitrogen fixation protein NifB